MRIDKIIHPGHPGRVNGDEDSTKERWSRQNFKDLEKAQTPEKIEANEVSENSRWEDNVFPLWTLKRKIWYFKEVGSFNSSLLLVDQIM